MDPSAAIRVVHLVPHLSTGGAELQLLHLIANTPPGRATHRVLYYRESDDHEAQRLFAERGVDARLVPRSSRLSPAFLRRLGRAIDEARPDIVHCWLPNACVWGRLAARPRGARRLVLSIRGTRIEMGLSLRIAHLTGDRGVYYLGNTRAVAAAIRRHIGARPERIGIVPNGVAPVRGDRAAARTALLAEPGGGSATRIVLSVGRLAIDKNYPMLLRVARRFAPEEPVRFFVVGPGELEASLKREARLMGLEGRLQFLGLRRDIPDLMAGADLFAFTSRTEGAPNALLEAMMAGLPIVTTRFEGLEDLLTPGRDARVVEHDDDAGFETAIRRLLGDAAASRALGEAARRTAGGCFGIPAMVETTLAFYRRILDAPD